jgi:hypothetical protein
MTSTQNITQAQIDAYLASGKKITKAPIVGDGFFPVHTVSLNDLYRFSSFANGNLSRHYRWIPTN